MGKRTRIVLYALSLVTMLAMVTLIIFSHGRQSGAPAKDALSETDISSTEEPVQIPEAEESEETEAADGQNRIQNDTEQEEADIADDTTLIFARRDGSSRRAEQDPKRHRTGRSGHSR